MRKNVSYFKVNYGIVAVSTTALVMFMNPWSLIVLAFLALAWGYAYIVRTTPLVLGGRELRCGVGVQAPGGRRAGVGGGCSVA